MVDPDCESFSQGIEEIRIFTIGVSRLHYCARRVPFSLSLSELCPAARASGTELVSSFTLLEVFRRLDEGCDLGEFGHVGCREDKQLRVNSRKTPFGGPPL